MKKKNIQSIKSLIKIFLIILQCIINSRNDTSSTEKIPEKCRSVWDIPSKTIVTGRLL